MCLTEPHAGSDVGALRTRAVREGDHYRISGTKIFITYGEHDYTENTIHMVLARTPDAPPGTRGISLFLIPKFLVNPDGSPGPRNEVRCVSLEEKLGIHASPTCVMSFGDDAGAIGYLVGEEHGGMRAMFTMMNNARLQVGLEGLAIAERAYQAALAYARERVQGRRRDGGEERPARIIEHPDVRRMLMTMKTQIEAMRALAYTAAGALRSRRARARPAARAAAEGRLALLTPLVKAWCTDLGFEIASTALQVHGGMGYIEETGVAQLLRDARIAMIYEGTNGIQALDLVGRKLKMAEGACRPRCSRSCAAIWRRSMPRARRRCGAADGCSGDARAGDRVAAGRATTTTRMPPRPARRRTCACSRPRSAASCSPARRSPRAAPRSPRASARAPRSTSASSCPRPRRCCPRSPPAPRRLPRSCSPRPPPSQPPPSRPRRPSAQANSPRSR